MLDLSVVILTYNEELHLARCLDNVHGIAKEIFIIDSFSNDRTLEIASRYPKVRVLQNKWENNYAKQFNWGLENAPITGTWILRLDADEYLMPELVEELKGTLSQISDNVNGLVIKRRGYFLGSWMKRGVYPVKLLRIFRNGFGKCEQRLMDEHIQIESGDTLELENDFVDDNLNDLSWYCHKHVNYAVREAADLLDIELGLTGAAETDDDKNLSPQAIAKRKRKHSYARKPLFWRSFAYFLYRYIAKGAFLDGKKGFIYTFLQAWWYRTLVDAKVYELKSMFGTNAEAIKNYLEEHYNLAIESKPPTPPRLTFVNIWWLERRWAA